MKRCDMDMVAVVIIGDGCGLSNEARHRNQLNKNKLSLYSCYLHFNIPLNDFTQATDRVLQL